MENHRQVWSVRNRRQRRARRQSDSTNSSSANSAQSHASAEAPTASRRRRVQAGQSNPNSSRRRAVIEDSEEDKDGTPSHGSPEPSDIAQVRKSKGRQAQEDASVEPSRSSKSKKKTKKAKKETRTDTPAQVPECTFPRGVLRKLLNCSVQIWCGFRSGCKRLIRGAFRTWLKLETLWSTSPKGTSHTSTK